MATDRPARRRAGSSRTGPWAWSACFNGHGTASTSASRESESITCRILRVSMATERPARLRGPPSEVFVETRVKGAICPTPLHSDEDSCGEFFPNLRISNGSHHPPMDCKVAQPPPGFGAQKGDGHFRQSPTVYPGYQRSAGADSSPGGGLSHRLSRSPSRSNHPSSSASSWVFTQSLSQEYRVRPNPFACKRKSRLSSGWNTSGIHSRHCTWSPPTGSRASRSYNKPKMVGNT